MIAIRLETDSAAALRAAAKLRGLAHEHLLISTCDAETDAALALVSTMPTTLAGVQAVLRYAAEHVAQGHVWTDEANIADDDGRSRPNRDWNFFLHRMLADALAEIAPAGDG
jgi:hypothetical protein